MLGSIILGIIQGITEFFPISSTAHLVLVPWFAGWEGLLTSLPFDVALHAGTLVSLLVCFRKDIADILTTKRGLILPLVIGTIPAGVFGILFDDYIETTLRSPYIIAASLVIFGVVMYLAERFTGKRRVEGIGWQDALLIGFAQSIALIPGTSRSGITISAGLWRGFKREEAARFSFLLSIPIIAGATLLEGRKLLGSASPDDLGIVLAGFLASAITGILAINFLIGFLKRHTLNAFVLYRFALAGLILGWMWLGR